MVTAKTRINQTREVVSEWLKNKQIDWFIEKPAKYQLPPTRQTYTGNVYQVILKRALTQDPARKRLAFYYNDNLENSAKGYKLRIADALYYVSCIAATPNNLDTWCAKEGFDKNQLSSLNIFRNDRKIQKKLIQFFTTLELAELNSLFKDY